MNTKYQVFRLETHRAMNDPEETKVTLVEQKVKTETWATNTFESLEEAQKAIEADKDMMYIDLVILPVMRIMP